MSAARLLRMRASMSPGKENSSTCEGAATAAVKAQCPPPHAQPPAPVRASSSSSSSSRFGRRVYSAVPKKAWYVPARVQGSAGGGTDHDGLSATRGQSTRARMRCSEGDEQRSAKLGTVAKRLRAARLERVCRCEHRLAAIIKLLPYLGGARGWSHVSVYGLRSEYCAACRVGSRTRARHHLLRVQSPHVVVALAAVRAARQQEVLPWVGAWVKAPACCCCVHTLGVLRHRRTAHGAHSALAWLGARNCGDGRGPAKMKEQVQSSLEGFG